MQSNVFSLAALLVGLALLTPFSSAEACSCMPPDVEASFERADHALVGKVVRRVDRDLDILYVLEVRNDFSGCFEPNDRIVLQTPNSGSLCGQTNFREGADILVFGYELDDSIRGMPVLSINVCDYNRHLHDVTPEDWIFLFRNQVDCGPICVDLAG